MSGIAEALFLKVHIHSMGAFLGAFITICFLVFSILMYFSDQKDNIVKAYIWFELAIFLFLAGYALYVSAKTIEQVEFWTRVCYSGVALLPLTFHLVVNAILKYKRSKFFLPLLLLGVFWLVIIWSRTDWLIGTTLQPLEIYGHPTLVKGAGIYFFELSLFVPLLGCWLRFARQYRRSAEFREETGILIYGFSLWILSGFFDALIAAGIIITTRTLMWVGPTFLLISLGVYFVRGLQRQAHKFDLLAQEKDTIYQQMIRDDLTQLYSRNYINSVLKHELDKLERYPAQHALLFIDVDDFQKINDQLGHRVGDQLLFNLGNILRQSTRASDVVARYGGDEFLILLLNCTEAQSTHLAYRILKNYNAALQQLGSHLSGRLPGLSIGISPSAFWNNEVEDAVAQADYAMFQAKGAGKNKVKRITGRDSGLHWLADEPQASPL